MNTKSLTWKGNGERVEKSDAQKLLDYLYCGEAAKGKSKTIWLEAWSKGRLEAGKGMRGEGKIQIGFDAGLELGQSNPVKAFNTKLENGKGR